MFENTDINIYNSSFIGSKSYSNGGGLYMSKNKNILFNNNTFRKNFAQSGGGIYFSENNNFTSKNFICEENYV